MTDKEYPFLPDKVDIYISYTQRVDKDKEIAHAFCAACEAHRHPQLRPFIDTKDIPYQANIYKYMDTLSSAPFVVGIFSEGYFQSENCVLEFVGICHNGYMEHRLHPLFNEYFFNDKERKKWMLCKEDDELLQERVRDKTGKELKVLLHSGRKEVMERLVGKSDKNVKWHMQDNFKTFITTFLKTANSYNKEQFDNLRKELVRKIQVRLAKSSFKQVVDELAEKLQCLKESSSCAEKLFSGDVVANMKNFVACRSFYQSNQSTDRNFREIFGFLLVSTINQDWWTMNEFHLRHSLNNECGVEVDGLFKDYEIEVVFARINERPAMYRKDGPDIFSKHLMQSNKNISFTSDAQNLLEQYLRAFYEDITHTSLEGRTILENGRLMNTLEGRFDGLRDEKSQYFYIISAEEYNYMKKIDVLREINSFSNMAVQFVVVGESNDRQNKYPVLTVESKRILGCLSEIYHG